MAKKETLKEFMKRKIIGKLPVGYEKVSLWFVTTSLDAVMGYIDEWEKTQAKK